MAADMTRKLTLDVYVVTSAKLWPGRGHLDVGLAAIEGGATALQLRAPELESEPDTILGLANELAARCRGAGVPFVVNNLVDVALKSGADGAHVGQSDDPAGARARLGSHRVLGVSVDTPAQAMAAEGVGADYVAATVWETTTKPDAKPIGLDGLGSIVRATRLPVVGIGGIDASNVSRVLAAGAAGVAIVSAVGAAPDPVAATRALTEAVRAFRAAHQRR